jgi:hypothetical protein
MWKCWKSCAWQRVVDKHSASFGWSEWQGQNQINHPSSYLDTVHACRYSWWNDKTNRLLCREDSTTPPNICPSSSSSNSFQSPQTSPSLFPYSFQYENYKIWFPRWVLILNPGPLVDPQRDASSSLQSRYFPPPNFSLMLSTPNFLCSFF